MYVFVCVYLYSNGQFGRTGVLYGPFATERRGDHGRGHGRVADAHRTTQTVGVQDGQLVRQRLYERHVPGTGHKNHVRPVARPPGVQATQAPARPTRSGNGHHREGTPISTRIFVSRRRRGNGFPAKI